MPFPVQVDANGLGNVNLPIVDIGSATIRYAFLIGSLDSKLHAWKSTDTGVTWVEMDAAGAPFWANFNPVSPIYKASASKVFVVATETTGQFLTVFPFSTATDTWSAAVVTGNELVAANSMVALLRSFDSNIVIIGSVPSFQPGVNLARLGYCIFDTVALTVSAWVACGVTNPLDLNAYTTTAIFQGSGRVHFNVLKTAYDGSNSEMSQQALTDGGALGVVQLIGSAAANDIIGGANAGANTTDVMLSFFMTSAVDSIKCYSAPIIANDSLVWSLVTTPVAPVGYQVNTWGIGGGASGFTLIWSIVDSATFTTYQISRYTNAANVFVLDEVLGTQSYGSLWALRLTSGDLWAFGANGSFWYWESASAGPVVVVAGKAVIFDGQLIPFPFDPVLPTDKGDGMLYGLTKTKTYRGA